MTVAQPNKPKGYRLNEADIDLMTELMQFHGVTSDTEILRMAFRALNRERYALEAMYPRPAQPAPEPAKESSTPAPAGAHKKQQK